MNPITVGIGVLALAFGLYVGLLHLFKPAMLGKLEAMKERYGVGTGRIVHIVFYVAAPIAFGTMTTQAGLRGTSFF